MGRLAQIAPLALLGIGLAQMTGDLLGIPALKGLAAATVISPAPKVFSAVKGLETYSTRFRIEWSDGAGTLRSVELTPETCRGLRGPYNRRNVYGAALAYGPILAMDERARPMLDAVLSYGLARDGRLLGELGCDPNDVQPGTVRIRYQPLPGTDMGDFPTVLEVR